MAYKRKDYAAHDGDKTRRTPRRMRAEHKVIKDSRYKGDLLSEKIADVEDRLEFLREDMHSATPAQREKLNKGSKKRQRARAIKKLEKRRDQYRAEYKRLNEKN